MQKLGQQGVGIEPLRSYIRRRPRTAAALAFGSVTMAVTHFAWVPDARMNGLVPALTIAAGVAHAVAGAITGRCLVDGSRTVRPSGPLSYLLLTVLTGVFSFLGAGWALLLASVGVGWALYRVAIPRAPA